MVFEWDEAKRLININRHNLDFVDADLLFGGPHVVGLAKLVAGEQRYAAIGKIDDIYATAIYVYRGDAVRMISLRRSRGEEKRRYQALHGG